MKKYITIYPWFFSKNAHALWTFPLPPAPFCFFYICPPIFIFWVLFLRFCGSFCALYRTKKIGVSLSLGLVNIYIYWIFALLTFNYLIHIVAVQYPVGFLFFGGALYLLGFCYLVGLLVWFLLELFLLYLYSAFIFWGVFYFAFFHIFLIFFDFVFLFLVVFWFFFHIISSVQDWSYSIF